MADLKVRMEKACEADNLARQDGQPAVHKTKLLPEVMSMLNRNRNQAAIVDPDTNFLLHVKVFLEPLNDGSLPAYQIQREIFDALLRLPIEKDTLVSSEIGKVVFFYTKSRKPELNIKRMAERLVGEWSRLIIKRTDDYKKRYVETRDFDYQYVSTINHIHLAFDLFLTNRANSHRAAKRLQAQGSNSQLTLTQRPALSVREAERERILAPPTQSNRARVTGVPTSYSIAPRSTYDPSRGPGFRPIGSSGLDSFKKIVNKTSKKD